jgi:uncharacterized protein YkwD
MFRVVLSAGMISLLGACSLGSGAISSGYAEQDSAPSTSLSRQASFGGSTNSIGSSPTVQSVALGGEPAAARDSATAQPAVQKIAKIDDKAPVGSFERAPHGALADRDYTHTALDPESARTLINAYRKSKGLKPLTLNPELTAAAKAHSRDLARWDRISHFGSDGSNPWDRVKRTGYHARLAAENVGTGQIDFQEVMRGWKESPGHNKNLLLPDARDMGIALVQDPKSEFKSFWTLVIGSQM